MIIPKYKKDGTVKFKFLQGDRITISPFVDQSGRDMVEIRFSVDDVWAKDQEGLILAERKDAIDLFETITKHLRGL